jgi:hypothetical protein
MLHHVGQATHFEKFAIAHRHGLGNWVAAIDGMKSPIGQNDVCFA